MLHAKDVLHQNMCTLYGSPKRPCINLFFLLLVISVYQKLFTCDFSWFSCFSPNLSGWSQTTSQSLELTGSKTDHIHYSVYDNKVSFSSVRHQIWTGLSLTDMEQLLYCTKKCLLWPSEQDTTRSWRITTLGWIHKNILAEIWRKQLMWRSKITIRRQKQIIMHTFALIIRCIFI